MESGLGISSLAVLFGVMLSGALLPSMSSLLVATRTMASGYMHGVLVILGIVLGDVIFILIAILGLSLLVEQMGPWFVWIKYLGGVYLIGLGYFLFTTNPEAESDQNPQQRQNGASIYSSFAAGLMITLADQKAILFYLGIFPALMDLEKIHSFDVAVVIILAMVTVGGAKLVYVWAASSVKSTIHQPRTMNKIYRTAGMVLIVAGLYLVYLGSRQ